MRWPPASQSAPLGRPSYCNIRVSRSGGVLYSPLMEIGPKMSIPSHYIG